MPNGRKQLSSNNINSVGVSDAKVNTLVTEEKENFMVSPKTLSIKISDINSKNQLLKEKDQNIYVQAYMKQRSIRQKNRDTGDCKSYNNTFINLNTNNDNSYIDKQDVYVTKGTDKFMLANSRKTVSPFRNIFV